MGYTTTFQGRIHVAPPLDARSVAESREFSENTPRAANGFHPAEGLPGLNCDWFLAEDGSGIEWTGMEKSYDNVEWVQYIIDRWVRPASSVADGTIQAWGEEPGDVWFLVVENNVARRADAAIFPKDPE